MFIDGQYIAIRRGRPKGAKDRSPRKNTNYFKSHNPRRAYGRRLGSLDKAERDGFGYWTLKHNTLDLRTRLGSYQARLNYLLWLKDCISGKLGREFRGSQTMRFSRFLEPVLIPCPVLPGDYIHECWEHYRHFVTKEEGFRHIRQLKRLRWKRLLSVSRKISRLKKAIVQEQIKEADFSQRTNN